MGKDIKSGETTGQPAPDTIPSSNIQSKTPNFYKLTTYLLLFLLLAASFTSIYLYVKSKANSSNTDSNVPSSPSPTTSIPTPTPADYFFMDPSIKLNYFPVQYSTYSKQQQKVAQTFTLTDDLTISAVKLKASFGVGNNINLEIYEAGNVQDLTQGTLVGSGMFPATDIVKESTFEVILEKPVHLKANEKYAFVISVDDTITQTAIAFSENNILKNGSMYEFTRSVGGNGELLSNGHSWAPINNQDLLYTFKEF
jgi:hypothetical protein